MAPDDITIRLNYVNFFVYQNQFDLARYHLNVAEDLASQINNLDREVREVTNLYIQFDMYNYFVIELVS